jgi:hypothetical protein
VKPSNKAGKLCGSKVCVKELRRGFLGVKHKSLAIWQPPECPRSYLVIEQLHQKPREGSRRYLRRAGVEGMFII